MWIGLLFFIFIVFFGRLAFRRLHARRCDQFLAPLAKCQTKLVEYHFATRSASARNKNNKKDDTAAEEDALTTSKPITEDGIPLVSVSELHTSIESATPLKTVESYLPYCPTICLSIGGQRVVWTRSPNFMRRALLTHFRMFPGPPTKSISSYDSAASTSSA